MLPVYCPTCDHCQCETHSNLTRCRCADVEAMTQADATAAEREADERELAEDRQ